MLILAGLLLVFGSVVAGYLLERGNMLVLLQPSELLIIGGGAAGILLISSPARNLKTLFRFVHQATSHQAYSRRRYFEVLKLLYSLFQYGRRAGNDALEPHIDSPHASDLFKDHALVLSDREATNFICDSFRIAISAGLTSDEIERLMVLDMDVQRSSRQQPLRLLTNVADSLPGLGIVAAVLGVVVTMQALGGPASEIGHKVAAALVGTFLGILLCYGVISPIATHLECLSRARQEFLQVVRAAVASFFRGSSPIVATEAARRSIPLDLRPSFDDMANELRRVKLPPLPASAQPQAAQPQQQTVASGA